MNLLAFLLLVPGVTAVVVWICAGLLWFLGGRDARRDAARRNGAHKL